MQRTAASPMQLSRSAMPFGRAQHFANAYRQDWPRLGFTSQATAVLNVNRERDARFVIGDALSYEPDESYDYVVASGIFGYAARGMRARVQPTLERLFAMCGLGVAVNFLSRCAPARSPGRLYLHPYDVLQFAVTLTPAVRLDHTYMPNDFTLHLYRTPPWQEAT